MQTILAAYFHAMKFSCQFILHLVLNYYLQGYILQFTAALPLPLSSNVYVCMCFI